MSIADKCREHVMQALMADDFHGGETQRDRSEYWEDAEDTINRMTNMELLELISEVQEDSDD